MNKENFELNLWQTLYKKELERNKRLIQTIKMLNEYSFLQERQINELKNLMEVAYEEIQTKKN